MGESSLLRWIGFWRSNCQFIDLGFSTLYFLPSTLYFLGLKAQKIGVTGFEPAASASRTQRSTRLSHTPVGNFAINALISSACQQLIVIAAVDATSQSLTDYQTDDEESQIAVLILQYNHSTFPT